MPDLDPAIRHFEDVSRRVLVLHVHLVFCGPGCGGPDAKKDQDDKITDVARPNSSLRSGQHY